MATKKRVYIAGPISKGDLLHNIRQSDVAFKALMKAGFAPMNPMWSCFSGGVCKSDGGTIWAAATQTGGLDLKHEEWLGSDLAWVETCHAVLRLPGESKGADMETAHARENGIPVRYTVEAIIDLFAPPKPLVSIPIANPPTHGVEESSAHIFKKWVHSGADDLKIGDEYNANYLGTSYRYKILDRWEGMKQNIPARVLGWSARPEWRTYDGFFEEGRNPYYDGLGTMQLIAFHTRRLS